MSIDKAVDSTQLDADLTSVANAIRTKGGTSAQLAFPNGFVSAIGDIPTGGTLITKTITENGTYSAEDDDADGYSEVTVNVSSGGGTDYLAETCNNTITRYESDEVTQVYGSVFRGNTSLQKVFLKNCTTISNAGYAFTRAPLIYGVFPSLTTIKTWGNFESCSKLEVIDIGATLTRFSDAQFDGSSKFKTLILRGNSVSTLGNVNVFNGSPFASGKTGGTLYVPQALISSYQSASNWSTILGYATNSIVAIEGSQYENYYADGTPIST